jgi:hypothetical protein
LSDGKVIIDASWCFEKPFLFIAFSLVKDLFLASKIPVV